MGMEAFMTAEIHIYGKLRERVRGLIDDRTGVVHMAPHSDETVESLLTRLGLPVEEIYTIFFNHKVLATRTKMAIWIGHRQVRESPFDWDLYTPVKAGDRIGLFGRDMSALVV